jgi:hypothetical protein
VRLQLRPLVYKKHVAVALQPHLVTVGDKLVLDLATENLSAACLARCTSTQPNNGLRRPEQGERVEAAPNPLAIVSKIVRASDGTEAIRAESQDQLASF